MKFVVDVVVEFVVELVVAVDGRGVDVALDGVVVVVVVVVAAAVVVATKQVMHQLRNYCYLCNN